MLAGLGRGGAAVEAPPLPSCILSAPPPPLSSLLVAAAREGVDVRKSEVGGVAAAEAAEVAEAAATTEVAVPADSGEETEDGMRKVLLPAVMGDMMATFASSDDGDFSPDSYTKTEKLKKRAKIK